MTTNYQHMIHSHNTNILQLRKATLLKLKRTPKEVIINTYMGRDYNDVEYEK